MKQILIKKGTAYAEDVPAPTVHEDSVVVEVRCSCISAGTELSSIASSGESLLQKALRKPERIGKVIESIKSAGVAKTILKIRHKRGERSVTGYCAAGIVRQTGKNITDIHEGDRVACAGAGVANHAEYIEVPRNLLAKVPAEVGFDEASMVTLGAIGLQGVRRADPRLGEFIAVLGLGVLGQITVQLLKTNGCRVVGTDVDDARIEKALSLGMDYGINPLKEDAVKAAAGFSHGHGVDAAIITAASNSSEPLVQAFRMCRKKGKVVLVGVVDMNFNREEMYKKELDFLIATSYGPGRYDEAYEGKGMSYPYAYVRWTETRNMEECVRLIAEKKLNMRALIDKEFDVEKAGEAYGSLNQPTGKPLVVLLNYAPQPQATVSTRIDIAPRHSNKKGVINIAVIGAGSFATEVHLPNLMRLTRQYNLYAIAGRRGSHAREIAERFGAVYASTDYHEVLHDKNIDAVLIATRHNLHARIAVEALQSGKAVFLEKPMALHQDELALLIKTIEETGRPFMVGFNRRFSPYARQIREHVARRQNPMIVNYRMNAGYIPPDHWVHSEEGGGRIIGEACHIFDLFRYFTGAEVVSCSVDRITPATGVYGSEDNAVFTLKYRDGSICSLTYTALGNSEHPKEQCEIYYDGKVITLNDYKQLTAKGVKIKAIETAHPDKGQREEWIVFRNLWEGKDEGIPLAELVETTQLTFTAGGMHG